MYPPFIATTSKLLACAFWGFLCNPSQRELNEYQIPPAMQHRSREILDHQKDWQQFGITSVSINGNTVRFNRDQNALTNKTAVVSQTVYGWSLGYAN